MARMGALVSWLWEKTRVQEVLSSNPNVRYLILFLICLLQKLCFFKRPKIKDTKKRPGMAHFKKRL